MPCPHKFFTYIAHTLCICRCASDCYIISMYVRVCVGTRSKETRSLLAYFGWSVRLLALDICNLQLRHHHMECVALQFVCSPSHSLVYSMLFIILPFMPFNNNNNNQLQLSNSSLFKLKEKLKLSCRPNDFQIVYQ